MWPLEVLEKLAGLKGRDNRYEARCPAHEDNKPSLSVKVVPNDKIILKCMAPCSCSFRSIAQAIGVDPSLFFHPSTRKKAMSDQPKPKFIKAYDYRDETGKLIYQVIRWEPKRFSQRRPNPSYDSTKPAEATNQPWIYNLEGVTRGLYKLPELLAALKEKPDRLVFIVEGEKDVDMASDYNLVATCNSGGALKWQEADSRRFKDVNVVIIADNDPVDTSLGYSPGIKHAEEVAQSVKTAGAKSIKLLVMPGVPAKGDLTSWIVKQIADGKEQKQILTDLRDIIRATPDWPASEKPAQEPVAAAGAASNVEIATPPEPQDTPEPKQEKTDSTVPEKTQSQKVDSSGSPPKSDRQHHEASGIDGILAGVKQVAEHFQKSKPEPTLAEIVGTVELLWAEYKAKIVALDDEAKKDYNYNCFGTIAGLMVKFLSCQRVR